MLKVTQLPSGINKEIKASGNSIVILTVRFAPNVHVGILISAQLNLVHTKRLLTRLRLKLGIGCMVTNDGALLGIITQLVASQLANEFDFMRHY